MKKIINTAIVAATLFVGSFSNASAQSVQGVSNQPATQKLAIPVFSESRATSERARQSTDIAMIQNSAVRSSLVEQAAELSTTTMNTILPELQNRLSSIDQGGALQFVVNSDQSVSLLDQYTIEVKVSYDPRPVGGILNVKVNLVPVFSGVGIANRPVASRAMARAVDQISEESISVIVKDLSKDLAAEIGK